MNILIPLGLGFFGSIHCLGMCGPIVLAIPFSGEPLKRILGTIIYNIGRVVTYSIMGFFFGLFGKGLAMAGFQQIVSIVLGVIMILSVLFPFLFKKIRLLEKPLDPINNFVKRRLVKLIQISTYKGLFLTGILNGLLPCGFVYVAVAGAIATGRIFDGIFFMSLFGLATIPLLAALAIFNALSSMKFRHFYKKVLPTFVVVLGILFILRGLNLGIKYISPRFETGSKMEHSSCH